MCVCAHAFLCGLCRSDTCAWVRIYIYPCVLTDVCSLMGVRASLCVRARTTVRNTDKHPSQYHTHTPVYIHTSTRAHIHTCTHPHTRAHIHTYTHTHTHTCTYPHVHTSTHTHRAHIHTSTRAHIHPHVHTSIHTCTTCIHSVKSIRRIERHVKDRHHRARLFSRSSTHSVRIGDSVSPLCNGILSLSLSLCVRACQCACVPACVRAYNIFLYGWMDVCASARVCMSVCGLTLQSGGTFIVHPFTCSPIHPLILSSSFHPLILSSILSSFHPSLHSSILSSFHPSFHQPFHPFILSSISFHSFTRNRDSEWPCPSWSLWHWLCRVKSWGALSDVCCVCCVCVVYVLYILCVYVCDVCVWTYTYTYTYTYIYIYTSTSTSIYMSI